uniref:serpin B6-like isoform X1 n=2 Tax=Styela clava TaxID=7725 RepID=UPI00193A1CD6|nr:serpin B6-like isoform X1 [Styela clava]
MFEKLYLLLLIKTLLLVVAHCQEQQQQEVDDDGFYTLIIPPNKDDFPTEDDISKFQQSLRQFSGALFSKVIKQTKKSQNIFFSPTSISHGLAMVNSGAKGNTSEEIKRVMRVGRSTPNSQINALFRNVTSDKFGDGKKDKVVTIMASRSYFQSSYKVYRNYTDVLEESFYSGMDKIDFSKSGPAAKKVNQWVEDQTEGLIKNLISPDLFTPLTRFVLVNALYFKASWSSPFMQYPDKKKFKTPSGPVEVPYLKSHRGRYKMKVEVDHMSVAIPYKDEETYFIIMMPKSEEAMKNISTQGKLESYFRSLKKKLEDWKVRQMNLYMPEFTVEKKMDVKKILKTMGCRSLFSREDADLSGISKEFVYVTDFVHKARVTVNKDGTEAAAASGIIGGARSLYIAQDVVINKPFIYAIYEKGNILFLGRMVNPSVK